MTQSLLTQLNSAATTIATDAMRNPALGIALADGYDEARVLSFSGNCESGHGGRGTIAAGLKLAEICMGGLGQISLSPATCADFRFPRVNVSTDHPLLACMAAQYAGWPLAGEGFFAMCSGPARALRGQEKVLQQYGLVHAATDSTEAIGVLEANALPSPAVVNDFAKQCSVDAKNVMLCVARTASLPGTIQVVARSVETALHKLHELDFDLSTIKSAFGSAPLPPIAKDDLTALGWTNDAILYGATVNLFVDTTDEAIEKIMGVVSSFASSDFGTPFLDIFNRYDKDFYKIDKLLFSPAQVVVNNWATGRVFQVGEIRNDILRQSYAVSQFCDQTV